MNRWKGEKERKQINKRRKGNKDNEWKRGNKGKKERKEIFTSISCTGSLSFLGLSLSFPPYSLGRFKPLSLQENKSNQYTRDRVTIHLPFMQRLEITDLQFVNPCQ